MQHAVMLLLTQQIKADIGAETTPLVFFFSVIFRHFNLEEALQGASEQICSELDKSLTERNYLALTPALQATLTGQICNITQRDNPIRTLVGKSQWACAVAQSSSHLI